LLLNEDIKMQKKPLDKIRIKLHEKPDLIIGKNGLSDSVIKETRLLLKKKKIIKVKVLKNIAETKKDASKIIEELSEKTNAKIGKIIGKTAILYVEE